MTLHELQGQTILLDSNLAVLLCVGLAGREHIPRHKRLAAFDELDFDLLLSVVSSFSAIAVIPNIATETSNLLRQVKPPLRDEVSKALAGLIEGAEEQVVMSKQAVIHDSYVKLGLTDAAILQLIESETNFNLMTVDFDLYLAAAVRELKVINFNHLKEQRPDLD